MSHIFPRPNQGRRSRPWKMSSYHGGAGRLAMSEGRGFMKSSMVQLTLVRFREFIREPEAVFWTFIFPILLAAGLGIAFRQRGPDKVSVGVANSAGSAALIQSLTKDSTLVVETFTDSAGEKALRTGKIALLVIPGSRPDSVHYIYD